MAERKLALAEQYVVVPFLTEKKIGRKGLSLGRKKMFAPVTPVSAFSEYSNSIKKNN